jgi:ATP-binding cassette subfamily C (CFTR/MRP) protein 2
LYNQYFVYQTFDAGFIGMALSYGLSLNIHVIGYVQTWCLLENLIVSVERLEQYMHIPSEAAEVVEGHQPTHNWPVVGQVKICDLKVNITHTHTHTQKKKKKTSFSIHNS